MPFNLGDSNKDAKEKCYLSYILSSLKFVFSDLVYICFHFLTVAFFCVNDLNVKKKEGNRSFYLASLVFSLWYFGYSRVFNSFHAP